MHALRSGRSIAAVCSLLLVTPCCKSAQPNKPPAANQHQPLAQTQASAESPVQKGAALYARICAVCHGANGEGYKADHAPALNQAQFLTTVSDAFLRQAILYGRKGSTSAWS